MVSIGAFCLITNLSPTISFLRSTLGLSFKISSSVMEYSLAISAKVSPATIVCNDSFCPLVQRRSIISSLETTLSRLMLSSLTSQSSMISTFSILAPSISLVYFCLISTNTSSAVSLSSTAPTFLPFIKTQYALTLSSSIYVSLLRTSSDVSILTSSPTVETRSNSISFFASIITSTFLSSVSAPCTRFVIWRTSSFSFTIPSVLPLYEYA